MKRIVFSSLTVLLICSLAFTKATDEIEQKPWTLSEVDKAIKHCEVKVSKTLGHLNTYKKSPHTLHKGEKYWNTKPAGGWTSGF